MWEVNVVPVSVGMEETGYAHQVTDGRRTITVAYSTHRNYDYIHTENLGNHNVRCTGIGRREPDLTPHPDAVVVAAALNAAHAT